MPLQYSNTSIDSNGKNSFEERLITFQMKVTSSTVAFKKARTFPCLLREEREYTPAMQQWQAINAWAYLTYLDRGRKYWGRGILFDGRGHSGQKSHFLAHF